MTFKIHFGALPIQKRIVPDKPEHAPLVAHISANIGAARLAPELHEALDAYGDRLKIEVRPISPTGPLKSAKPEGRIIITDLTDAEASRAYALLAKSRSKKGGPGFDVVETETGRALKLQTWFSRHKRQGGRQQSNNALLHRLAHSFYGGERTIINSLLRPQAFKIETPDVRSRTVQNEMFLLEAETMLKENNVVYTEENRRIIRQILNVATPKEGGTARIARNANGQVIGMGVVIDAQKNFVPLAGDPKDSRGMCIFHMGFVAPEFRNTMCFPFIAKSLLQDAKRMGYKTMVFDTETTKLLALADKYPALVTAHGPGSMIHEMFSPMIHDSSEAVRILRVDLMTLKARDINKLRKI